MARGNDPSEYRKYKTTFPWHPHQRLPTPGCPPRHRTPPSPRAGRLTRRSCLGLGDRPQPSARRSETLPRWARGREQPDPLGETVANEPTASSRPALRLMQPSGHAEAADSYKKSRDVLYNDTPSSMLHMVLYGTWCQLYGIVRDYTVERRRIQSWAQ
jgi:hypothetical protein